jgi:hypothetical protein
MTKHIVQQGEDLAQIAESRGFKPETVWNDPQNSELKRQRKDSDILNPGDKVEIPEVTAKKEMGATEARHRFRVDRKKAILRLQFLDAEETPRDGLNFELDVGGEIFSGTTSGGILEQKIPRTAKEATVKFPEVGEVYRIDLGNLDSHDSVSGAQHRLANLGFGPGTPDGVFGPKSKSAIRRFQAKFGLEPTGELDDDTSQRLLDEHGC